MPVYEVAWEMWEHGSVEIEAENDEEAVKIFDDKHVGCLDAAGEGLDITSISEIEPTQRLIWKTGSAGPECSECQRLAKIQGSDQPSERKR